jgi:cyclopropane fatty-acyl-phospholipid synthase-like methyltransferase
MAFIGKDPSRHYDEISDAWRHIFGDNFHFGYFKTPDTSLNEATEALIEQLAHLGTIDERSTVLDVGCGVGAPAFYLYQKYKCSIVGISTSQRGIDIANSTSREKGISDKVQFLRADGAHTGLADNHFDVIWVLESSHLMDKKNMFKETFRVLKPGGQMLLCDVMLRHKVSTSEQIQHLSSLGKKYLTGYLAMKRAFGLGNSEAFGFYTDNLLAAGFARVDVIDVSEKVLPTIDYWRANVATNRADISRTFSQKKIDDFLSGSSFVEYVFSNQMMGYGLVKATKNEKG